MAKRVSVPGVLHDELASALRDIIHRQGTQVSRVELMEVLSLAVGGPGIDGTTEDLHEPLGQLLVFVNVVLLSMRKRASDASSAATPTSDASFHPPLEGLPKSQAPDAAAATATETGPVEQKQPSSYITVAPAKAETPSFAAASDEVLVQSRFGTEEPHRSASTLMRDPAPERSGTHEPAMEREKSPDLHTSAGAAPSAAAIEQRQPDPAWPEQPVSPPLQKSPAETRPQPSTGTGKPVTERVPRSRTESRFLSRQATLWAGVVLLLLAVGLLSTHKQEMRNPAVTAAPATAAHPGIVGEPLPQAGQASTVNAGEQVAGSPPGVQSNAGTPATATGGAPGTASIIAAKAGDSLNAEQSSPADEVTTVEPGRANNAQFGPNNVGSGSDNGLTSQSASRQVTKERIARARDFSSSPSSRHGARGGLFSVSSGMMSANLLSAPAPEYPALARLTHVEGEVILQAVVSHTGFVVATHALEGHRLLRGAAEHAVQRWRYRPFMLDGRPTDVETIVFVKFRLHH